MNFCLFSKTKSDSDSLLFAKESRLVGKARGKRNFAETILLFEISTFFGSSTPFRAIHYFFDHINAKMIENLFHEGHEQKTFFARKSLYKPLSGPELRSEIRFFMIEIFHIFSIFILQCHFLFSPWLAPAQAHFSDIFYKDQTVAPGLKQSSAAFCFQRLNRWPRIGLKLIYNKIQKIFFEIDKMRKV